MNLIVAWEFECFILIFFCVRFLRVWVTYGVRETRVVLRIEIGCRMYINREGGFFAKKLAKNPLTTILAVGVIVLQFFTKKHPQMVRIATRGFFPKNFCKTTLKGLLRLYSHCSRARPGWHMLTSPSHGPHVAVFSGLTQHGSVEPCRATCPAQARLGLRTGRPIYLSLLIHTLYYITVTDILQ